LKILRDLGEWTSYADWRKAATDVEGGIPKGRMEKAIKQLSLDGNVVKHEWKKGRTTCTSYAPSDWKVKAEWPEPPYDC
jgi:hypothetical protein